MIGSGTLVNVAAIAGGSLIGLLVGRGIKEKYQETVIYGLALCVILLGIQMALQGQHILLDHHQPGDRLYFGGGPGH